VKIFSEILNSDWLRKSSPSRGDHFLGLPISRWRFCKLAIIITKKHISTQKRISDGNASQRSECIGQPLTKAQEHAAQREYELSRQKEIEISMEHMHNLCEEVRFMISNRNDNCTLNRLFKYFRESMKTPHNALIVLLFIGEWVYICRLFAVLI